MAYGGLLWGREEKEMKEKEWKDPGAPERCPRCGGDHFRFSTIWNQGAVPPVPDFEDVWECRDCGNTIPVTK